MQFEVEQKFPVADLAAVAARLRGLGASARDAIVQVDRYFAHPARDFAQTDEALRIRQIGEQNLITYKGPKIDRVTKTRHELELPLAGGATSAAQWTMLLQALGFKPVAEVRKVRQVLDLTWLDALIEIALDQVDGVGNFVELEVIADESGLDVAKSRIQTLAAALGLSGAERRSYLELLLAATT
jgi:adenylate cyclase class 2